MKYVLVLILGIVVASCGDDPAKVAERRTLFASMCREGGFTAAQCVDLWRVSRGERQ